MDWVTWITWTAQAIMWAIIVLFFYMIVLAMHGAEKRDRNIDWAALERVQHEFYLKSEEEN